MEPGKRGVRPWQRVVEMGWLGLGGCDDGMVRAGVRHG